ncbi:hypothetical protein [Deinococcus ruber]|uniref:Uncharacterized protein n=1 Tax=Deinococcus ruber TaxID=1848197 RepID=A0A918C3T2_9DEIO|nr:hypothetical protein [Deinococcus ruber]GGR05154.1 hypothetical protein GCM10008957_17580 [Deinococcus ruber]
MKVRFAGRTVRVRIDDLEADMLLLGKPLELRLDWPGGGWSLRLEPQQSGVQAAGGGALVVGLADALKTLLDPLEEGVSLDAFGGDLKFRIEKDFRPEHLV